MRGTGNKSGNFEKAVSIRFTPDGFCFWDTLIVTAPGNPRARTGASERIGTVATAVELPGNNDTLFSIRTEPRPKIRNLDARDKILRNKTLADAVAIIRAKSASPTRVILMPDTSKAVLVPKEIFNPKAAAEYLSLNKIIPGSGQEIVFSDPAAETVAVIVVDEYTADLLIQRNRSPLKPPFNGISFLSPIQYLLLKERPIADPAPDLVKIMVSEKNMYVTVHRTSRYLLHASVMPATGPEDILFNLEKMKNEAAVYGASIIVEGTQAKSVVKLLRKYNWKAQCG